MNVPIEDTGSIPSGQEPVHFDTASSYENAPVPVGPASPRVRYPSLKETPQMGDMPKKTALGTRKYARLLKENAVFSAWCRDVCRGSWNTGTAYL